MNRASTGHRVGHFAGFTLIELLVVIAIIGILSSIVLASLSTARNKGADAKVQEQLSGARTAAEIYYGNNNNSYGTGTVSTCTTGMFIDTTSGMATIVSGTTGVVCGSTANAWAMKAPLVSTTSQGWCVDSNGNSKQIPWTAASVTACP